MRHGERYDEIGIIYVDICFSGEERIDTRNVSICHRFGKCDRLRGGAEGGNIVDAGGVGIKSVVYKRRHCAVVTGHMGFSGG